MNRNSDDIVFEVQRYAHDDSMPAPRWLELLNAAWERSVASNEKHDRGPDTSWFLNHRNGIQIWRQEHSDVTVGKDFSYRDYFHGRGEDYPPNRIPEDIAPLERPHVCNAYKSTTTGRQTVALSVPVKNKQGETIGVLARSVHLGDLQERMGRLVSKPDTEGVRRVIALVEARDQTDWRLLDHPYLTEEVVHAAEKNNTDADLFDSLFFDQATVTAIQASQADGKPSEVKLESYSDPISRLSDPGAAQYNAEWLAAMAPVSDIGWMVIVQEPRNAVLEPVEAVAAGGRRQAWLSILTTAIALMVIIWSFVWRAYTSRA
jgi:hypothetical protein